MLNEVFDLFAALGATDEQLDFPHLYASGKQGWAAADAAGPKDRGMAPLFDLVLRHVAPPQVEEGRPHAGRFWRPIPTSAASSPAGSSAGA